MKQERITIRNIPALVWGEESDQVFIAVHGLMSNKADDALAILAEEATAVGIQTLSFDLPQHGERKDDPRPCKLTTGMEDLNSIMEYAKTRWPRLSLFACSMGAYFSLQTWQDVKFEKCLFLSPMVDMGIIIDYMMQTANVTPERLEKEGTIPVPGAEPLYWDVYTYVKEHPITRWDSPTSILRGSEDKICYPPVTDAFAERFKCKLTVMQGAEHYFHTDADMKFMRDWMRTELK